MKRILNILPVTALLLVVLLISSGCVRSGMFGLGGNHKLREAEELSRQGKYEEAIQAYHEHMEYRLGLNDRPEWENPYFYYLLIGDLELGRGQVDKALESYALAANHQIHPSLISDRYRFVAGWYEAKGDYENAIALLKKHRELDHLLFDAMLDRLAKQVTQLEDQRPR